MLIDFRDLSPVRKSVEVEIPATAIDESLREVTIEFARHAKIPGFRQGKVPPKVVRSRYQKEIRDEVLDRLLPRFFREVIHERGLQPVGNPALKNVDPLEDGKPVRFQAEFEVKPSIELKEYRGLQFTQPDTEVKEEDVDAMVERLRDQASSFRPITDRTAADGDYVIIDVKSSAEGLETRTTESYQLHLGETAPIEELNDAVRGKSVGDDVEFMKQYGEDAPNEEVRGKNVSYLVKVKEIRVMEKPEVNDDLARSAGVGQSVEEMRSKIRQDLVRHREHEAVNAKRHEIGETLVELHELEAPDTMVQEELGKSLRNYARFLASQGIDLETAQIDWEKVRGEFLPEATKRVKRALILEAIARKESLQVNDVEVDAEIRKAATGTNREFAEVKHRLKDEGDYEDLRLSLMQERALELVLGEAKAK